MIVKLYFETTQLKSNLSLLWAKVIYNIIFNNIIFNNIIFNSLNSSKLRLNKYKI